MKPILYALAGLIICTGIMVVAFGIGAAIGWALHYSAPLGIAFILLLCSPVFYVIGKEIADAFI